MSGNEVFTFLAIVVVLVAFSALITAVLFVGIPAYALYLLARYTYRRLA